MQGPQADLEWHETGVPVSKRFDDPYFSLENGMAETRHVFLGGNGLPARFRDGFHIAELGFGTGLNLLTTWQAWQDQGLPGQLCFTSFEAFPMSVAAMRQSLALFPVSGALRDTLLAALEQGKTTVETRDMRFELIIGDARETLPAWQEQADAWFLDGFSPAKNPELWDPALLQQVYRHTAPGGTAATYTAAGAVRRALAQAGFGVTRSPGFGRKRHMTTAQKATA